MISIRLDFLTDVCDRLKANSNAKWPDRIALCRVTIDHRLFYIKKMKRDEMKCINTC